MVEPSETSAPSFLSPKHCANRQLGPLETEFDPEEFGVKVEAELFVDDFLGVMEMSIEVSRASVMMIFEG
jgi:hypothetical protein